MPIGPLTTPPIAPSTLRPSTFAPEMDARLAWNDVNVAEMNVVLPQIVALAGTVEGQVAADNSASVAAAAGYATASAAARDGAIAAWAASMAPAETLPAFAQSLHYGAIVRAFLYDASKDSDGGAWRKRCQQASWYAETIQTGAWRGQRASLAATWAISGAAVGDFYQSTADGLFYVIGGTVGSPTQTQIYRGNAREFPAQVAIIAEAGRVVIYDLTQVGAPMWMVFKSATDGTLPLTVSTSVLAAFALNGKIFFAIGANAMLVVDFITEKFAAPYASGTFTWPVTISGRNTASTRQTSSAGAIVSSTARDIAATVLPGAPIDPATGLPVPTVAVATAGGVSLIKNDGTIVNSAYTGDINTVSFSQDRLCFDRAGASWGGNSVAISAIAASFAGNAYTDTSVPATALTGKPIMAGRDIVLRGTGGITRLRENPTTPASGMVAYITIASNSGWQVGDIRFCGLADTVAETVTASGELVTNGDFAGGTTTGWTAGNGASLAVASGEIQITSNGTAYAQANQNITCVVNKIYKVTCVARRGTAVNSAQIAVQGANSISTTSTSNVALSFDFVATSTTHQLSLQVIAAAANGETLYFDNISVKLATPDRSVKNNGFVLNGSLTKAAVASAAQLVGYSNWSTSNYLEQPYNSQLDFGTGDFCVMGWLKPSAVPSNEWAFFRGEASVSPTSIEIAAISPTDFRMRVGVAGTFSGNSTTTILPTVGQFNHVAMVRLSGVVYIYINGVFSNSYAFVGNITNTSATCLVGVRTTGALQQPWLGSIALLRIGATAPSADQIAKIYRDELKLFQPGAQCTIAGTSSAVTALAYDDVTDLLHVGTSWGRTSFNGLVRVDSEATTVGAITSVSAYAGGIVQGGASTGRFSQPAIALRDMSKSGLALGGLAFVDYLTPVVAVLTSTQTFRPKRSGWYKIIVQAGGAGGATDSTAVSSGGAGGGAAVKILWLDADVTYTVTVGAGGAAIVATDLATGNSGGSSSFAGEGISTISATGGSSHLYSEKRSYGGLGTGGDFNFSGGNAFARLLVAPFPAVGDQGGLSYFGAGGRPGADGVSYGTGAGGVVNATTSFAGKQGVVVIEYLTY